MKIEKLTPEQESQLSVYADKWIKIGLKTGSCNRKKVEKACRKAYAAAKVEFPEKIIWVDNPIEGMKECRKLEGEENNSSWEPYWACYGQHDAGWLSRYSYYRDVTKLIEETEDIVGLIEMAECGWWWPYDQAVVLCECPVELNIDVNGNLHKEGGPAIAWTGYGQWYLHGVSVEKWMAEDDPTTWTTEKVMSVENVEQRREVIARFGKDRLWGLAKVIDKSDDGVYELGELSITGSRRVALCMRNPSVGCYHVEWVAPTCTTVQDALDDRASRLKTNFGHWKPEKMS